VEEQEVILYLPNDSVDGFVEVTEKVRKEPQAVVDALIAHSALPEGTKVLKFEMEDGDIVLDLSREFETALCSMGTSGEAMLTGSLVFTLLDCWGADTLTFTCEGRIVESGHVVYDFPLSAKK
jgi:spore germination protein GerM